MDLNPPAPCSGRPDGTFLPRLAKVHHPDHPDSWMGLLAVTSLGADGASAVRAQVRANIALSAGRSYRLIVQSYPPSAERPFPSDRARPLASIQRSVTPAEMKRGVRVDLLELRQPGNRYDGGAASVSASDAAGGLGSPRSFVLAWVEEGRADLEYDGRRARPQPGSFVGAASRDTTQRSVRIAVKHVAAVNAAVSPCARSRASSRRIISPPRTLPPNKSL